MENLPALQNSPGLPPPPLYRIDEEVHSDDILATCISCESNTVGNKCRRSAFPISQECSRVDGINSEILEIFLNVSHRGIEKIWVNCFSFIFHARIIFITLPQFQLLLAPPHIRPTSCLPPLCTLSFVPVLQEKMLKSLL